MQRSSFSMMFALAFVAVVFSAASVVAQDASQCSYADMQSLATDFSKVLTTFDVTESQDQMQAISQMQGLTTRMQNCTTLIQGFVTELATRTATMPDTKQCYDYQDQQDPCCNWQLAQTKCCAPRSTQYQAPYIKTLNAVSLAARCAQPDKVGTLLSLFVEGMSVQMQRCSNSMQETIGRMQAVLSPVGTCFQQVFYPQFPPPGRSPAQCSSNADCASNNCDLVAGTCDSADRTKDDPSELFAKCFIASTPREYIRAMMLSLQLSGTVADNVAFAQKLAAAVRKDMCLDDYGFSSSTAHADKASCEAERVSCNDGSFGSCTSTAPFCAAKCRPSGVCRDITSILSNSEEKCNTLTLCQGGKAVPDFGLTREQCEGQSYCTACELRDTGCTQESCPQRGICYGFPNGRTGVCVASPSADKTCPGSGQNLHLGRWCWENMAFGVADAQQAQWCTDRNGTYVAYPQSQAECEQYKACEEQISGSGYVSFTPKSDAECSKCSGSVKPIFQWTPGQWKQRIFTPAGFANWTARAEVSQYRWVQGFDSQVLYAFVQRAIGAIQNVVIKSFLQCAISPMVGVVRAVACDCAPLDKLGTAACFAGDNDPTRAKIASFLAFRGMAAQLFYDQASIKYSESSVKPTTDQQEVGIVKSTVVELHQGGGTAPAAGQAADVMATIVPVTGSSGGELGQIVGDGTSLTAELNTVDVCLTRDQSVQVAKTSYSTAGFCTKRADTSFALTQIAVTSSNAAQICATLTGAQTVGTYFPCVYDKTAADAEPKPGVSPVINVNGVEPAASGRAVLAALAVALATIVAALLA